MAKVISTLWSTIKPKCNLIINCGSRGLNLCFYGSEDIEEKVGEEVEETGERDGNRKRRVSK